MRYSDDIIEEVRSGNDIVDVVSTYVHLQKKGSSYFGLCPFHNEKSPSFSVSPGKQIFYCFGCGAGGNVITFLMKYENYSFQEALRALADRAGIRLPEIEYSAEMKKREERRLQLLAVNKEAATYYYRMLRSPKGQTGLAYFRKRELSEETMKRFGLGYADGSGSDLTNHLRGCGFADDVIAEAGVASFDEKRGLHDKFWNRVIFPIQDISHRVIGFGGRVMGDAKPKYLNSPETPVFDKSRNLYGLHLAKQSRKGYFILCEGYMDVIAMHQAGFPEAVASLGTSFTEGQAALLKRYVNTVILSYDSDTAGVTAALRGIRILKSAGLTGKVLNLKPYKDPDEFMKALGREEFQKRLDEAENCFFFEIRTMEGEYDLKDPAGRTAFSRALARKLCEFEEEVERENYLRAMAQRYFIDTSALRKLVTSYAGAGGEGAAVIQPKPRPRQASGRKPSEDASLQPQRLLLTWLADYPEAYGQVRKYLSAEDFSEGLYRQAAEKFLSALEEGKAGAASVISCFAQESEQQEAARLFNTRVRGLATREECEKAFHDALYAVKKSSYERMTAQENAGPQTLTQMISGKRALEELARAKFTLPAGLQET
ncbi:MAG: DNA primase [Eubacteriales bacterium]|nr:DNA primase [Eubacteriales bacterium]